MADRTMEAFQISTDAARLTLILVDHKDPRRLARPSGIHDIHSAHALAGGLPLA